MINGNDIYSVMAAVVPLYVAMVLAYASVRRWKIFTPDQCSGISGFVVTFAIPFLSFHFISTNDVYAFNLRFVAADTLQKVVVLVVMAGWAGLSRSGTLDCLITVFSLSTLPNTLVMGIPLLIAMYGADARGVIAQAVVLQFTIWYTVLLFLFEYRAAKMLIVEQFPGTGSSIASFKVDSDVVSLDGGNEHLQAEAEVGHGGELHVTVRKSTSSGRSISTITPRPSSLTGAEFCSLSTSKNPTPRGSGFNHADLYSVMGSRPSTIAPADLYSPRPSNVDANQRSSPRSAQYPAPNPEISSAADAVGKGSVAVGKNSSAGADFGTRRVPNGGGATEIHVLIPAEQLRSGALAKDGCEATDHLESFERRKGRDEEEGPETMGRLGSSSTGELKAAAAVGDRGGVGVGKQMPPATDHLESFERRKGRDEEEGPETMGRLGSSSTRELKAAAAVGDRGGVGVGKQMPPVSVTMRLILIMVWRKLIRNPNTYSSLVGITWSLIAFRWNVHMPKMVEKSITILSDTALGMAMFNLGLFMALQPKLIACGNRLALVSMGVRFLAGPAVMAAASMATGLRGTLLRMAIVQAALPQGIVPFVFAKEYNVHPTILSAAVIFGMLIALPITLAYYVVLGL